MSNELVRKLHRAVKSGRLMPSQITGSVGELLLRADSYVDPSGLKIFTETEVAEAERLALVCGWRRGIYPRRSFDEHAIAVTSLSRSTDSIVRQQTAIQSWVDFGLSIVSMNTEEEVAVLAPFFPQVDEWIYTPPDGVREGTSIPLIRTLARVAISLDRTILLINSDIEIRGSQSDLIESLAGERSQVVGIRWNRSGQNYAEATREQYGLDVFSFTPEMAATLPPSPLCIGKPVWDYWVPCHFRLLGYSFEFIGEPFFFHELHDIRWSQEEWMQGGVWLTEEYGSDVFDWRECVKFRQSFPYPPRSDAGE